MANLTHTVSGDMASFKAAARVPIESLKVHFTPKQLGEGDPSPDNVREIVACESVTGYASGKNLFDINTPITRGQYYDNGVYGDTDSRIMTDFIPIIAWKKYTMSIDSSKDNLCFINYNLFDENKIWLCDRSGNGESISFSGATTHTVTINKNNAAYIRLVVRDINSINISTKTLVNSNLQFEVGAVATSYEPYQGTTIPVTFPTAGKNLLNLNVEQYTAPESGSDPSTKRTYVANKYIVGISPQNYYRRDYSKYVKNLNITSSDVTFTLGAATGYGVGFIFDNLTIGETYTLSATQTHGGVGFAFYSSDGSYIDSSFGGSQRSYTIPSGTAFTIATLFGTLSNAEVSFSNIQLEQGSTATSYEPYFPEAVYDGYVDLVSGEVWKEWGKITSPTWENCRYGADLGGHTRKTFNVSSAIPGAEYSLCNNAPYLQSNSSDTTHFYINSRGDTVYLILPNDTANNYTVDVVYKLATPQYVATLTPHQLRTFLGTNNIWADSGAVDVSYAVHNSAPMILAKKKIMNASPHIASASGSIVNFSTDMASPLKSCKVGFLPKQEGSGDPSPENIRAINGWNELNVYKCGENLFNYETAQINDGYIRNDSGAVQASSNWFYISTIYSIPDEGLLISLHPNFDAMRIYYLTDNDQWVGRSVVYSGTRLDVSKKSGFSKIQLSFYNTARDYIKSLSIEKKATIISDSQKTVIPISWQSSLETIYGGWVDLVSGELWKTYEKITCDGTGQWSVNNYSTYNRVVKAYGNLSTGKPKNNGNVMFNYIKFSGYQIASWNGFIGSTGNILAYVPIEYNTSVIWKNYLSDNPLNICYELETPILVTTLSPQQLKTLKGTNNIWSDTNGTIETKYYTH